MVTTRKKVVVKGGMSSADVRAAMLTKIEASDLSSAHAKALGLEPHTAEQCRALKLPATKAGFKIPYWGADGKQLKFFRYRYMEETRTGFQVAAKAKALRYAQPAGSPTEIYLPPLVKWAALLADPATPLLITEGELKSACATRHGMPCIGLGGVWSFMSTKKGDALLPALKEVNWEDRTVFICYDSDGATNPNVVQAEARLAARLTEAGAAVFICRIPTPELEAGQDTPRKVGIDDYIVEHGVDVFKESILELAFEYAASEALHKLSQRVVYVRNPGIMWDHQTRQRMAPSAFKEHAFSNVHYFEKRESKLGTTLVKVAAAKAWLDWEHRAECPGLQFAPGQGRITDAGDLNTWTGWGVTEPVPGDIKPWYSLTKHIFGDELESLKYFEQWAAFPIQNPGVKMHVAAAIWGPVHGSGKTLLGHTLMRIYGRAHSAELKDSDLESARYEWAEDIQFALADDITSRGDRKFMRKLMTMITQKYIRLDPKYIPSYTIADVINYYFTSNDPDALFMDDQDRRFFVHEVRGGKYEAWREYVKWMKSDEGVAALWHYLLGIDMTGFDPHAPAPTTLGKESMIELGKSELGAWVYEFKLNTDAVLERSGFKGDLYTPSQLHMLFDPHGDKKASVNALGRELKRSGYNAPGTGVHLRTADGRQVRVYAVRNIEHWRTAPWKDACKHYIDSNPELTKRPTGKKF